MGTVMYIYEAIVRFPSVNQGMCVKDPGGADG
jgi:hypothetical protein